MYILTPSDRCTLSGIDKITDNKQHFYKQRQAKIGKKSSNQANAKQHLEDELLLFENYSPSLHVIIQKYYI